MKSNVKTLLQSIAALLVLFTLNSAASAQPVTGIAGEPCHTLLAGQTTAVGQVCLSIAGENLVVEYQTDGNWYLSETQLWVGDDLTTVPQTKKGNPVPGQFPWKQGQLDLQSYDFVLPLSNLNANCDTSFYLAAHASVKRMDGLNVVQSETAWSAGQRFVAKGNWATWSGFSFSCAVIDDEEPEENYSSETAFAMDYELSRCFAEDGFSRWGWTNGPINEGYAQAWPLYAGAAQCDLSKGTYVGDLLVSYQNGTMTVHYQANGAYSFSDAQVYAGSALYPVDRKGNATVAPGQYTRVAEFADNQTEYTVVISNLSGPVYVIAHATTYGPFADDSGNGDGGNGGGNPQPE